MLIFAGGVAYGVVTVFFFFYTMILGVVAYQVVNELEEDYSLQALTVHIEFLGLRALVYVAASLLWPLASVAMGIMAYRLKKYQSREEVPESTQKKLDWLFLGFGKLP